MATFHTYKTEDEKRDFLSTLYSYTISNYLDDSIERIENRIAELKTYPKTKTLVRKFESNLSGILRKYAEGTEREEQLGWLCEEIESKLEDKANHMSYSVMYHPDYPGEYMAFEQYRCKRCRDSFDAMSEDLCDCIWEF